MPPTLERTMIKMIKYKPRLTNADMPANDNKYYIRKADGGYSPCIKGYPQHNHLTALSNCVGWVVGRVMEILRVRTNPLPCCNAEDFYNSTSLAKGQTPKNGAVICWRKGKLWNGNDGAGHVAVVEKVVSDTEIITSESAYGGRTFYTKTRKKGNGNWGAGAAYTLMGFIYPPEECVPDDETTVIPDEKVPTSSNPGGLQVGDVVDFKGGYHYSSSMASKPAGGKRTAGKAKITAIAKNAKHKYHLIGESGGSNVYGWVDANAIKDAAASTPLAVGDKVKVRPGAKTYRGGGLATFVYKQTYTVKQIGGVAADYVVIGTANAVTAAVRAADLIKA